MRARQITSFGDPIDLLQLVELDEPGDPGPGDVLVSVQLSPLNIHDLSCYSSAAV